MCHLKECEEFHKTNVLVQADNAVSDTNLNGHCFSPFLPDFQNKIKSKLKNSFIMECVPILLTLLLVSGNKHPSKI